jgi:hypothetical protein
MSTWLATTLIAVWTRQPGCETTVISNLSSGAATRSAARRSCRLTRRKRCFISGDRGRVDAPTGPTGALDDAVGRH